ncbi:MAG: lytic transglycosylase domain-containing protein [Epsilonproteobacteria bacterium]|nr:lytic transglycosylase domain-containing protein [Campylobacterota bacterium]
MKNLNFSLFLKSFIIICIFFVSGLHAVKLSPKQIEILKMVRNVAKQYPNRNGETFENTAMAISLSETSAGVFKVGDIGKDPNIFKASLGIMQVRLETARFVAQKLNLTKIKQMSDVQLVNHLLGDDKFNVYVAVKYIVWLNDYTKNYFRTVSRYNGGNYNKPYYYKVMRNMRFIRSIKELR